jgi:hypothetical protein
MIAKLHTNKKGGSNYDGNASMISEDELLKYLIWLPITEQ